MDDLSDAALHFLFTARRLGCTWVAPCVTETPHFRELVAAGVIKVHPIPVCAVRWFWEWGESR